MPISVVGPYRHDILASTTTADWPLNVGDYLSSSATEIRYQSADGFQTIFHGTFQYNGSTITFGNVTEITRSFAGGPTIQQSINAGPSPLNVGMSDISIFDLQSAIATIFDATAHGGSHFGGSGNNTLRMYGGDDYAEGRGGNDLIFGDAGSDTILGGFGNDTIEGGADADNIVGNQGNDSINGGAGDDYAHGGADDDTLIGEDGNDRLDGGAGADTIDGGAGSDILIANQGNDSIVGGADGDYMHGGQDNDTLQGGDGNDVLVGGVGSDNIDGGNGFDGAAWVGLRSAYTVTNNGGGSWTVVNIATGDTDTVANVEFLVFDDQVVS